MMEDDAMEDDAMEDDKGQGSHPGPCIFPPSKKVIYKTKESKALGARSAPSALLSFVLVIRILDIWNSRIPIT